jgi:hypothetical protein
MISQSAPPEPQENQSPQATIWTFVMMGVMGHLIFGAYPVVA